jgi:hypothetical protein
LGVLHEAHAIRQELYDAGGVSSKFVPVLFSDGRARFAASADLSSTPTTASRASTGC